MRDPHDELGDVEQVVRPADSHGSAANPRPKDALLGGANRGATQPQKALDARADIPLHVRPVLDYAEIAALGIIPERTLRRLVATGRVKRAVLRAGRRVRFVVQDLIDELRGTAE